MIKILWEFLTNDGTRYVEWTDGVKTKLRRLTQEQYDALFSINTDLDFLN